MTNGLEVLGFEAAGAPAGRSVGTQGFEVAGFAKTFDLGPEDFTDLQSP